MQNKDFFLEISQLALKNDSIYSDKDVKKMSPIVVLCNTPEFLTTSENGSW